MNQIFTLGWVCAQWLSHILVCDPLAVACQAPLFMGFSRQEYWSGVAIVFSGDLAHSGIKPLSFAFPALAERFFITWITLTTAYTQRMTRNNLSFFFRSFLGVICGSAGKEITCYVGGVGSIPGLGRSPGEGNGNPLQYSGLENYGLYSPWGRKESDTIKWLSLSLSETWRT